MIYQWIAKTMKNCDTKTHAAGWKVNVMPLGRTRAKKLLELLCASGGELTGHMGFIDRLPSAGCEVKFYVRHPGVMGQTAFILGNNAGRFELVRLGS